MKNYYIRKLGNKARYFRTMSVINYIFYFSGCRRVESEDKEF